MLGLFGRGWFAMSEGLGKLHPRFMLCPRECAEKGFDTARVTKCDECPVKRLDDGHKEQTLDLWQQTLGVKAEKYRFENVQAAWLKAIRFKELSPERMTVYQHGMVGVYEREKSFIERARDYEDAQKRKQDR